jgi:hypothetical protein
MTCYEFIVIRTMLTSDEEMAKTFRHSASHNLSPQPSDEEMAKTRGGGSTAASKSGAHKMTSNWEGSTMSLQTLQDLAKVGLLLKEEEGPWHAPGDEIIPAPRDGELVFFTTHIERGLSLTGLKFFRELMVYCNLRLQDLDPNSIL